MTRFSKHDTQIEQRFQPNFLLHGADYNYEQWLDYPDILEEDFRLMREANCNVMSVGIFSWAMLEPAEGQYDFEWLDQLMDTLHENGIQAIFGNNPAVPNQPGCRMRIRKSGGWTRKVCVNPTFKDTTIAQRLLSIAKSTADQHTPR